MRPAGAHTVALGHAVGADVLNRRSASRKPSDLTAHATENGQGVAQTAARLLSAVPRRGSRTAFASRPFVQ